MKPWLEFFHLNSAGMPGELAEWFGAVAQLGASLPLATLLLKLQGMKGAARSDNTFYAQLLWSLGRLCEFVVMLILNHNKFNQSPLAHGALYEQTTTILNTEAPRVGLITYSCDWLVGRRARDGFGWFGWLGVARARVFAWFWVGLVVWASRAQRFDWFG